MGISNSWFAVRGVPIDEALAELGLERNREIGDDWPGRELAITPLPDDWIMVLHPRIDGAFGNEFVALSKKGPAVACSIEEHVMCQEARGYRDGAEVWRVVHDPNRGESLFHLEVSGAPPPQLDEIRARLETEQKAEGGEDANVDFISDVPLELAKSVCGFKHDDEWPEGFYFTTLRRSGAAPGPGFFARLFGRRS